MQTNLGNINFQVILNEWKFVPFLGNEMIKVAIINIFMAWAVPI